MTTEELMDLADKYAQAYAQYWEQDDRRPASINAHLRELTLRARAALKEALNLTSQFGGL